MSSCSLHRLFALLLGSGLCSTTALAGVYADSGDDLPGGGAAFGDMDGDGDLDLVTFSNPSAPYTPLVPALYWNDGDAGFTYAATIDASVGSSTSSYRTGFATADFDGDGIDDLFHAGNERGFSSDAASQMLLSNGDGTFVEQWSMDVGNGNWHAPAVGDLDGDGDVDVLLLRPSFSSAGNTHVLLNDGAGNLTLASTFGAGNSTGKSVLVDIDADGDLDALIGALGGGESDWEAWLNDGSGGFTFGSDISSVGDCSKELDVADFDGDGDFDVITTASATGCQYKALYRNDGSGTFTEDPRMLMRHTSTMTDVDMDGDADFLARHAYFGDGTFVYLNDGTGSFDIVCDAREDKYHYTPAQWSGYLSSGGARFQWDSSRSDLDGDGDEDTWNSGKSIYLSQVADGTANYDAECDGFDGTEDVHITPPVTDSDGDGVDDDADICPGADDNANADGDAEPDGCDAFPNDATETADSDGDGVGDNADAFPFDPSESADTDGDGVGDVADACPLDATDDTDLDGVCDSDDVCPGYDDGVDGDGDGTADGCDACPVDYFNDSDGDGLCDSADFCPLDALNDADLDGLCAEVDACPNDPDNDIDYDGVCGDLDICPNDSANDADGDGVCGDVDTCAGGDDSLDADADGTADFCDMCPNDAENDADMDGLCADVDICPADGDNDLDNDGVCGDVDWCPADYYDDSDGDAVCDSDDPCPDDVENDADGDGFCESSDNCPAIANASQDDADGDTIGDACEADDDGDGVIDDNDNCPMDANLDQADADADGAGDICDADADGDSVMDGEDACLGTPVGEPVLDNGCSVAEACPCDGTWKNHGAYEKCVSHALKDLRKSGLVTGSEAREIRDASEDNECGKTGRGRGHHDHGHSHSYDDESSHDCNDRGHRHNKRRHR
jgi:hypothetical protein